ncbi:hypothetical protein [Shewanella sp. UCD-KL12]|uniref:hypothetical protein n=1 Tax=Shewanella sp. UCD-KL12 TaxID=1917163 RepID=UPI000970A573
MIAVVLLQFAGGNMGEHQLHLGSHDEEPANHPHVQFTAQVTTVELEQCTACTDASYIDQDTSCDDVYADGQFASNGYFAASFDDAFSASANVEPHTHKVSKTETKLFDLCLDCQCHGGHATVMSALSTEPTVPTSDELIAMVSPYLPPEALPDYRPPIV